MNVVSPGMVETPAMRDYLGRHEGAGDMFKQMMAFGRLGDSAEIASAVLLASEAASFVAGHEFFVAKALMAV